MAVIKLGVAPTRRSIFSAPDAVKYCGLTLKKLEELGIEFVRSGFDNGIPAGMQQGGEQQNAEYGEGHGVSGDELSLNCNIHVLKLPAGYTAQKRRCVTRGSSETSVNPAWR